MITVEIDGASATLDEAVTGGWITEQIKRRERDGSKPCVRISITETVAHVSLATPTCQASPGGRRRRANQREQEVLDLWDHHSLNDAAFSPGNLQAFLRRLSQLFG